MTADSLKEPILVLGHRNPDMDAIAAAVGYAWVLNEAYDESYQAGRVGPPNAQTKYALERFGLDAPPLVADVRARVSDVTEQVPHLHEGQTILEACQSIARTVRPAPLLRDDMTPIGLLTGAGLFASLADALSSTSVLALAKEFDRPAVSAISGAPIVLRSDAFIQDIISTVIRAGDDDFLVVDSAGKYVGLCRKSNLISPPRHRVVMVDHNELQQAVPGLEEAEIVEVLDHHRLSTVPTQVPIRFAIEPVGSTSTLVFERGVDHHLKFPPAIAGTLLCGILSDTLVFRSPTATPRDRAAAFELAKMAQLRPTLHSEALISEAIEELGSALLAAGAGLGTRPAAEIVGTDFKDYEVNEYRVRIAQVEVTSFAEVTARLDDLRAALQEVVDSEGLAMALLMITDVVRGNSRLLAVGESKILSALPYARNPDDTLDAPQVVSRKKQLLPTVLAALSQL
jgi:manganese-dependent inorganic pyrophosphatase